MNTERITDLYGRVIGTIETKPNGDKTVKDYMGRILGYYKASTKTTTDYMGRIISRGGDCSGILFNGK